MVETIHSLQNFALENSFAARTFLAKLELVAVLMVRLVILLSIALFTVNDLFAVRAGETLEKSAWYKRKCTYRFVEKLPNGTDGRATQYLTTGMASL